VWIVPPRWEARPMSWMLEPCPGRTQGVPRHATHMDEGQEGNKAIRPLGQQVAGLSSNPRKPNLGEEIFNAKKRNYIRGARAVTLRRRDDSNVSIWRPAGGMRQLEYAQRRLRERARESFTLHRAGRPSGRTMARGGGIWAGRAQAIEGGSQVDWRPGRGGRHFSPFRADHPER